MSGNAILLVVAVQVAGDVAQALRGNEPRSDDARDLLQVLDERGVVLKPMHPGTRDPALVQWFTIEVQDFDTAERLVALLQGRRDVTAAYVKSPDEMP